MRSTNPVFTRSEQFSHAPAQAPQYGQQQYGDPHGAQAPFPGGQAPHGQQSAQGVMTIDDVITKSAITMGALVASAAVTFMFLPPTLMLPALILSGIVGFVAVLMVSLRRVVNPAFVLAYSVIEGVFIGAFSLLFERLYPGIVANAVLGTFVAAGATLAGYKFLRSNGVKVTSKFRKIVTISTFGLLGVVLINLLFSLFGGGLGLRAIGPDAGPLAWLVSAVAVVLAVANLIMDFDYIEQGIRNRLPATESWRAAFGLTVTMVWLYTEILRILSYFRQN
ncbi:MAG: Bax inhibitor-1/YccA family protein [Propionibacteriaceae bacterium]|nr:Bax inhibitor-1/YccA family protein [Propionibacteriaceae bacterium]